MQCIPVTFTPPRPLAYHRWVTILVQHHTPLFVDFIGNAFTETVKPGECIHCTTPRGEAVQPLTQRVRGEERKGNCLLELLWKLVNLTVSPLNT